MEDNIPTVDLRTDPQPIQSIPVGYRVTGVNGTDTVWKVVAPGVLKKVAGG